MLYATYEAYITSRGRETAAETNQGLVGAPHYKIFSKPVAHPMRTEVAMHTATRSLLLVAILSVVSCSAAKAFDPLGLCCQSGCCSSACDEAPCGSCDRYCEPTCGCDAACCDCYTEPGCDCYTEPGCGCYTEPGCGCYTEPGCGCDVAPGCGCDSSCDALGYGSCCKPVGYCTMFGGYNMLQDYEGQLANQELRGTFEEGWLFGVAAGRRIHDSMRAELEFTLRTNTGDKASSPVREAT